MRILVIGLSVLMSAFVLHSARSQTLKNLPEPTGPYTVGIFKIDLVDNHRKELEYPNGRLIPVGIYFPMQKGKHILHPKIFEERAPRKWQPLAIEVYGEKADLSSMVPGKHPVIFLLHGNTVAMTDYAVIGEDLASHGYVVVTMQHQLYNDPEEPKFWGERSISKYGHVIDNMLFVFEWLQDNQEKIFHGGIDLNRIGLIGHSMGGNALLLFANRASQVFKKKVQETLFMHRNPQDVREAIIVLDTGGFPYPSHNHYPLLLLLSAERESYQKKSGAYDDMIKIGHQVRYYKGSKHISFMDHGYIDPANPLDSSQHYFDGTLDERKNFFDQLRSDIRDFLKAKGIV